MRKILIIIFFIFIGASISAPIFAQENPSAGVKLEVNFFYSKTCTHCIAEQKFLDSIETKYLDVKINRYLASDSESKKLLADLLTKHDAQMYAGLVPITFVGED